MKASIYCAYLYADGHAVVIYEKQDSDAGSIKYVEVYEKLGPECNFKGRLVVHRGGLFNLLRRAKIVRAVTPSLSHGSQNTQEKGIEVGYLELTMSNDWTDTIAFYEMPGLISGPHTYQPTGADEAFDPDASIWGQYRIARVHRVKPTPTTQAVAV